MLESKRLYFIRINQLKLQVDKYCNLHQSTNNAQSQGSNSGKRVILPSTLV
ncbi:hypothetical protein GLYMA_04G103800v4 [Glycine max]|uniref:Uncharacterized protein n=1 Tax=Glycine max TaxID=3847 RepID=K7KJB1_SOYBN|nr:hypothetical protein JHK87_009483 [Glycine soja]KAH1110783.1 hypothetical protein GYH30_009546 [Glycine max]KRH62372.1 hypothetical protein GLYMA_04G103800v4 [Glycine max]